MTSAAEIVEVTSPEQIEQVRSLFREYQSALPEQYRFPDREWLNLPGEYASPQGALLLANVTGRLAGCVGLRPFPLSGACEMKRLYVRPAFRGLKLGKALVEQVIRVARRMGYACLRLDTHPDTMRLAVALYVGFGFREVPADPAPNVDGLSYMELRFSSQTPPV
jgi:GNAT superfamily N-acetyltransferase